MGKRRNRTNRMRGGGLFGSDPSSSEKSWLERMKESLGYGLTEVKAGLDKLRKDDNPDTYLFNKTQEQQQRSSLFGNTSSQGGRRRRRRKKMHGGDFIPNSAFTDAMEVKNIQTAPPQTLVGGRRRRKSSRRSRRRNRSSKRH